MHILRLLLSAHKLEFGRFPALIRCTVQAVFYSPVLVLPLPQSLWLRFTLPIELVSADGGETLLRNKMVVDFHA